MGHALFPHRLLRDALAKGHARLQAFDHFLQRHFGTADDAHAVVNAPRPKAPLRNLKTAALAQQQIFHRHTHVLQNHLGMTVRRVIKAKHWQHAHHFNARCVQRHKNLRLLRMLGGRGIGLAHHDGQLAARVAHARRPPLAAIDDVVVTIAHDAGVDVGGVAGGDVGLGHQEGGADFTGQQRLQPARLVGVRRVARQHFHVAGVWGRAVEHLRRKIDAAHLLGTHRVFQIGQARALVGAAFMRRVFGQEQVPQAFRLGFGLQRFNDGHHLPAVLAEGLHLGLVDRHGGVDVRVHESHHAVAPVDLGV